MTARVGIAFCFGVPAVLFAAAYLAIARSTPAERVLARAASPDGRRVATVVEIEAHAPQPPAFVARVGDEDVFVAFGAPGMTARWRDAKTLEVAFGHARFTRAERVAGVEVVAVGVLDR